MNWMTYMNIERLYWWTTFLSEETWRRRAEILGAWETFVGTKDGWLYGRPRIRRFPNRRYARALDMAAAELLRQLRHLAY